MDREIVGRIAACYKEKAMNRVILTGMGSSLYAARCVQGYLTGHGIPALVFSSFELSRFQFNQEAAAYCRVSHLPWPAHSSVSGTVFHAP